MQKAILVSALAAIAAGFGASAAGAQSASGFDGFYVGAHGSYGKFDSDVDVEGFLGGIHGGYNYVTGSVLLGVEGDYTWSDVSYDGTDNILGSPVDISGRLNYIASVRARLGYLYGSSTLFYATAGYNWSEVEVKATAAGFGTLLKETVDLDGAVVGGGVEYKFTQSLSARVEGLHYWGGNGEGFDDEEAEVNVVRLGLSYYFK